MNRLLYILFIAVIGVSCIQGQNKTEEKSMQYNKLTPEEERVIVHKGTEAPYTGEYVNNKKKGIYVCRRCNTPLYNSSDKFDSHCGWPSFDESISGKVQYISDVTHGMKRTEILCANCGSHLGHVFDDGPTKTGQRYCVNSLSVDFKLY